MMQLKSIILTLERIKFLNLIRTIRFALIRDWLNRNQWAIMKSSTYYISPGKFQTVEILENAANFEFENSNLEVFFVSPDIVRISWEPGEIPIPYTLIETEWPDVNLDISQDNDGWNFSSDSFILHINEGGVVTYRDLNGHILRKEFPPFRMDNSWFHFTEMEPDLHIYGLGERASSLNLRGGEYQIWNTDPRGSYGTGQDPIYLNIPAYLGMHEVGSYLIFYENSYKSTFSFQDVKPAFLVGADLPLDANEEIATVQFENGALRYYFFPGSPEHVIKLLTRLTGRPAMPPRWALGYHQSRWGYKSESEIRAIADGFSKHDIPISAIHLDIDYMNGYRVFTVDDQRFPNLAGLSDELMEKGIRLVAILDPGIKRDKNFSLYSEGIEKGLFCTLPNGKLALGLVWPGWSVYPDFTDPVVRRWWGQQYLKLLEQGISGIWHDMNEPTSFAAWGDLSLPLSTRHNLEGQLGDHRQAHNLYGLLMNKSGFEAIRKLKPTSRPWILSRSGWAGIGHYAWVWTADIESTWEALQQTVRTIIGLGISGIPFSGSDIGGFSGNPSPELYIRWFQVAAFTAFFRTHSAVGTARREPWMFSESVLNIIREIIRLRYKLIPYLYNLSYEATQSGIPLIRPIFWSDPDDEELWEVEDQFFLGDSLIIAPVLEKDLTSRSVVLPRGHWFDFWNENSYHGPGKIIIPVELETIPIFVRAGSLLPTLEGKHLNLHLYPPAGDIFESWLYSDAGDGYGPWRIDRFHISKSKTRLDIHCEHEGQYPFPYKKINIHLHGFLANRAWIDNTETFCNKDLVTSGVFDIIRIDGEFSHDQ